MSPRHLPPDAGLAAGAAALSLVAVQRHHEHGVDEALERVCEELPVALAYNGVAHAVMMATPADLEDLAVGFSVSEGIVAHASEILDLEACVQPRGIHVELTITARRAAALKERRRTLAGRTGCGLCGVESLQQFERAIAPVARTAAAPRITAAQLAAGFAALESAQPLRDLTGATHAAAWLAPGGELLALREDVGRHNALDKTIGALLRSGVDVGAGAALVTSRASYEMVAKAAAAGIGLLAARSAPTALAVRTARELGVTLAGFVRAGRHVAYAHGARLHAPGEAGASPHAPGEAGASPHTPAEALGAAE